MNPSSRKIYIPGSLYDSVRVPMREITLTPTVTASDGGGKPTEVHNPPLAVYDTSGPCTDPDVTIDLRKGLDPLRLEWIKARGDVETYSEGEERYRRLVISPITHE